MIRIEWSGFKTPAGDIVCVLCFWTGLDIKPSQCLFPLRCINIKLPVNLTLGVTLRWTSIQSRGNTPSHFMLLNSEMSAGLMGHLALE